jgi:hypothetical protein
MIGAAFYYNALRHREQAFQVPSPPAVSYKMPVPPDSFTIFSFMSQRFSPTVNLINQLWKSKYDETVLHYQQFYSFRFPVSFRKRGVAFSITGYNSTSSSNTPCIATFWCFNVCSRPDDQRLNSFGYLKPSLDFRPRLYPGVVSFILVRAAKCFIYYELDKPLLRAERRISAQELEKHASPSFQWYSMLYHQYSEKNGILLNQKNPDLSGTWFSENAKYILGPRKSTWCRNCKTKEF